MARTFAVGDIHGDIAHLERLLGRLPALAEDDTLLFLGDYVDRGPCSREVVERVRGLQASGICKVVALRGNHEDAWVQVVDEGWLGFVLPRGNGCLEAMRSFVGGPVPGEDEAPTQDEFDVLLRGGFLPEEVLAWMRALPYFQEDEHAIYVHAGLTRSGLRPPTRRRPEARAPLDPQPRVLHELRRQARRRRSHLDAAPSGRALELHPGRSDGSVGGPRRRRARHALRKGRLPDRGRAACAPRLRVALSPRASRARMSLVDETHETPPPRPTSMIARVVATSLVLGIIILVFLLLHDAGPAARRWTFTETISDASALGLRAVDESGGRWQLEDHASATGGRALVNLAGEPDARDAFALATKPVARDVKVATRCKTQAGSGALACGLVLRYVDPSHHYVAAVDVARSKVTLKVVAGGEPKIVAEVAAALAPDAWHDLAVEARGDVFVISFDRKAVLTARDATLRSSGTVGLWAPSASVSFFDELSVETLVGNLDALEIVPVVSPKKNSG